MDKMSECRKNLMLFFNRPREPCFMQKGDDDTIFHCPSHFYPAKYAWCVDNLERFDEDVSNELGPSPRTMRTSKKSRIVDVRDIELPDLSSCLQLPYNDHFSLFVPKHRRLAGELIDLFMGMPDLEDLQALCAYSQMRINPYMFNYCLSVAILNRKDTKGMDIPSLVETFPDKFISPLSLKKAREISTTCTPDERVPIKIPQTYTASDAEPEQRVAYFREDIGVNLHHWHWHLVYPFQGTAALVNKDRRGELFYYMHQQIVARYNVERFCNGLSRARPYENFREPIEEGYFPKLASEVASRTWQPRFSDTIPSDIRRPGDEVQIDVFEMEVLKERILQAIENMAVRLPNNEFKLLDEDTGIDVLGNMIEASQLSPNDYYYGNYHNTGHLFICYSHDPDFRHLERNGVMGDSATAMRDPVFYRLHTHINDLFRYYKSLLPPYPRSKLEFPGVRISRVRVESAARKGKEDGKGEVGCEGACKGKRDCESKGGRKCKGERDCDWKGGRKCKGERECQRQRECEGEREYECESECEGERECESETECERECKGKSDCRGKREYGWRSDCEGERGYECESECEGERECESETECERECKGKSDCRGKREYGWRSDCEGERGYECESECEGERECESETECERDCKRKSDCRGKREYGCRSDCEGERECELESGCESESVCEGESDCDWEREYKGERECEKVRKCKGEGKRKGERECKRDSECKGQTEMDGKEKREGKGTVLVGELSTQWEQSEVDLDQGLDFTPRGRMLTCFTHLTHDDFHYVIEVSNSSGRSVLGCVRLFLAPLQDQDGEALLFEEQRNLAIELDKFTHNIPVGTSTIRRSSKDSSVTIPYERTFRAQSARPGKQGTTETAAFDFCGCGWPHHMLIPKGTVQGYPMVLFCMITNWDEDKVEQDLAGTCSDAASYCGIRDRKYPDRRPMGFPFDRRARVATLRDFLTPNMAVADCVIRFKDEPEKYKSSSNVLENRFSDGASRTIEVRNIALPNLSLPMELPYNEQFSLFVPKHRKMAGRLIDIFMNMRDVDDLVSICSYCQMRINPYMFNYCLSVAILHRDDTKGLNIPTFAETFPDKFMDPKVFRRAREVSTVMKPGDRLPVLIPQNYTASENEPEQRVAYFREDIGINLHHWHWHLVYPFDAEDRSIVDKDRRGELFYYMHQQIIARYSAERMCNGLARPRRYNDFRQPIEEGYFPKLDSQVASRSWPPRFAGSTIRDIDRPVDQIRSDVSELETWRERFIQAINDMAIILPNGRQMKLDEETGIDVLGNLMESSIISRNRGYYGDLHNMGHVFISYTHDPDHRNLEQFGVMGDSATAMRDPVFYRWHAYIDDIFLLYKNKLPPYPQNKLDFPGIRVSGVGVEGPAGPGLLTTQWEQSTVDLGRGLDFTPRGSVLARFTHLTHDNFNYVIQVNNTSGAGVMGTVRLFIAPVRDEQGRPLAFSEQKRLMIELDKFTQSIPAGSSTIRRSSLDSSVTIPYERTFRAQSARPGDPGSAAAAEFDFCGCGWPHHMLIPKGTAQGYPMVLFCMITNWNEDRVAQDLVGACNDAASYCGIRDRKYPDRRPMGFPFDRPSSAASLRDFLTPNMAIADCTIRFTDATRIRGQQG